MAIQRYILHKDDPGRAQVRANLHAFIDRLPVDKAWRVEIKPYRKERSLDQNAAVFGLAYKVIMDSQGLEGEKERQRMHTNFCMDFFGVKTVPFMGRVPVRTTTTDEDGNDDVIDKATMTKFYNFIQRTAAEYGIDVPDPDPLWREHA